MESDQSELATLLVNYVRETLRPYTAVGATPALRTRALEQSGVANTEEVTEDCVPKE